MSLAGERRVAAGAIGFVRRPGREIDQRDLERQAEGEAVAVAGQRRPLHVVAIFGRRIDARQKPAIGGALLMDRCAIVGGGGLKIGVGAAGHGDELALVRRQMTAEPGELARDPRRSP